MLIKWIATTEEEIWKEERETLNADCEDTLELTPLRHQTIDGFGGCFNELGWIALSKLSDCDREKALHDLFDVEGCDFNFCRMPIGASDYAQQWYSHNEHEGDYEMEHFAIDRDYKYLLPYIKAAKALKPDLKLFASPWSPPTWMKTSQAYNYGRLRMEEAVLKAYAFYFVKFLQAYEAEGIDIDQVHIQNEPFADQKFPSCLWSAEQFRVFIRDYIGPVFEAEKLDTELWLGTLNGPTQMSFGPFGSKLDLYDEYVDHILFDPEVRKYLKGVGYQWSGQQVISRTHQSFPELKLMQTENECGDGSNSWAYARYVFNLMRHYLDNGVNSYIYWNMVLEPRGLSTWGWPQNALMTVDSETKTLVLNPEYYVMKHFSHFVKPGAVRIETKGHWTGASVAFENPNGEKVIVLQNGMDRERRLTLKNGEQSTTVSLKPYSLHTFVLKD